MSTDNQSVICLTSHEKGTQKMSGNERQTILIVDDEATNLALLNELLCDAHQVLFATNGKDALRLAERERPDLILLDIMMPGMDGFEVCRQLKGNDLVSDIPVIFVTAKSEGQDESLGLELGAADYITKPINPAVVTIRVKNLLDLKRFQNRLSDKERYLRSVLENSPNMIIALDKSMHIKEANAVSLSTLGYHAREHLIGQHFKVIFQDTNNADLFELLTSTKGNHHQEVMLKKASGDPFYAFLTMATIKNHHGKVVGMVCNGRDITVEKRMREMIQQHRASVGVA